MRAAARDLHALGPTAVLVKGGHVATGDALADVLALDDETVVLPTARVATSNTHGTGCSLAAAVAAHLARGASVLHAVKFAQRYVAGVIASSVPMRLGDGPQGAMDHGRALCLQPPLREAAPDFRLYAVTDAGCNAAAGRDMATAVAAAVQGGATMIQIRCACISPLHWQPCQRTPWQLAAAGAIGHRSQHGFERLLPHGGGRCAGRKRWRAAHSSKRCAPPSPPRRRRACPCS